MRCDVVLKIANAVESEDYQIVHRAKIEASRDSFVGSEDLVNVRLHSHSLRVPLGNFGIVVDTGYPQYRFTQAIRCRARTGHQQLCFYIYSESCSESWPGRVANSHIDLASYVCD